MDELIVSTIGTPSVRMGEQPLMYFRTQKAQALLIYLAVEKQKIHRRETLMGLLWPDMPDKSARATLRQTLYLLRKQIPSQQTSTDQEIPFLLTNRQTVQVNHDYALMVDYHRFQDLVARGQADTDTTLLLDAIDLLKGEFLADFYLSDSSPFENWAEIYRERLRRAALEAMQLLTDRYIEQRAYPQAEEIARRQIERDNLREGAYRQLMTILALGDRRQEAYVAYDQLHKTLWDELGVTPDPTTQSLLTQIEAGALTTPDPPRNTLSTGHRPTSILGNVGRDTGL